MKRLVKYAFILNSVLMMQAPWIFFTMRKTGIFDFKYDSLIFFVLWFFTVVLMFFWYKNWDD